MNVLEFEKPLVALRKKIKELKVLQEKESIVLKDEIGKLETKAQQLEVETFSKLNSWEKTLLARHGARPYTLDFIKECTTDFVELHGDRSFRDDPSVVCGFCRIEGLPFMIAGHQKGRNTTELIYRNFGSPYPEGYRKAIRLMKLAEKFEVPIVTMIDTPGAYPGIGAEERGQSEAIAVCLREMAGLAVPVVSVVVGEGGSGGALALGVANTVLMLEHAIYSVISPEGCAGILWKDGTRAKDAAASLKYTAQELIKFKAIDEIIREPPGGAHSNPQETLRSIKRHVLKHMKRLGSLGREELIEQRYRKFRRMGEFGES